MAYFRTGPPQVGEVVSPILSQAAQTTNAAVDQLIYQRRAAEARDNNTVLYPVQRSADETHMIEVGYPVFTEDPTVGPMRTPMAPGSLPLVYTDLGNETTVGQRLRKFIGFAYANTPSGVGLRGEGSMQIGTVAVQVGGITPFWSNYEVLQPGMHVRICEPDVLQRGAYVVDVYRNDRMTKPNCIHATIRAATRPNWLKPSAVGDKKLEVIIRAVNAYYDAVGSGNTINQDTADVLYQLLNDHVGGGAYSMQMFVCGAAELKERAYNYRIQQQLVSATDKKYASTIVGKCETYTPPRTQGALSF